MTEVIKIGAIFNMNRKTELKKLHVQHYPESCHSLVE